MMLLLVILATGSAGADAPAVSPDASPPSVAVRAEQVVAALGALLEGEPRGDLGVTALLGGELPDAERLAQRIAAYVNRRSERLLETLDADAP